MERISLDHILEPSMPFLHCLADELLLQILSHLDSSTLCAVCLISKRFLPAARGTLFREFRDVEDSEHQGENNPFRLRKLLVALTENPSLADLIHFVDVQLLNLGTSHQWNLTEYEIDRLVDLALRGMDQNAPGMSTIRNKLEQTLSKDKHCGEVAALLLAASKNVEHLTIRLKPWPLGDDWFKLLCEEQQFIELLNLVWNYSTTTGHRAFSRLHVLAMVLQRCQAGAPTAHVVLGDLYVGTLMLPKLQKLEVAGLYNRAFLDDPALARTSNITSLRLSHCGLESPHFEQLVMACKTLVHLSVDWNDTYVDTVFVSDIDAALQRHASSLRTVALTFHAIGRDCNEDHAMIRSRWGHGMESLAKFSVLERLDFDDTFLFGWKNSYAPEDLASKLKQFLPPAVQYLKLRRWEGHDEQDTHTQVVNEIGLEPSISVLDCIEFCQRSVPESP